LHSPPPADNSRRPPPPAVVVVADFDTKSNEEEEEDEDDEKTAESVAKSANKAKPHRKARILNRSFVLCDSLERALLAFGILIIVALLPAIF